MQCNVVFTSLVSIVVIAEVTLVPAALLLLAAARYIVWRPEGDNRGVGMDGLEREIRVCGPPSDGVVRAMVVAKEDRTEHTFLPGSPPG